MRALRLEGQTTGRDARIWNKVGVGKNPEQLDRWIGKC